MLKEETHWAYSPQPGLFESSSNKKPFTNITLVLLLRARIVITRWEDLSNTNPCQPFGSQQSRSCVILFPVLQIEVAFPACNAHVQFLEIFHAPTWLPELACVGRPLDECVPSAT